MEHYRSTLSTAAAAVFGLVAAARVLHPGNFEDRPRPVRTVVAAVAEHPAATRADPPFDLYLRPSASSSEMAVLAPRMTRPMPAGPTTMPTMVSTAVVRPRADEESPRRQGGRRVALAKPSVSASARSAHASPTNIRSPRVRALDISSRDLLREADG